MVKIKFSRCTYKNKKKRKIQLFVTVTVFAGVGIALLLATHAATPAVSIQVEAGLPSSNVATFTSTTASGNAVRFKTSTNAGGGLWLKPALNMPAWWQSNLHFNWMEQNVTNPTGNMNLTDVHILEIAPQNQTVTVPGYGSYTIPQGNNPGYIAFAHSKGVGVICYMDTGAYETDWPDNALLSPYSSGVNTGWTGEFWLNVDNSSQWAPIILARIKYAASIGCDGIEGDQNDGVQNGVGTSLANEANWYIAVANAIHGNGMGWAVQKNGYFDGGNASAKTLPAMIAQYYDAALIEQPFELKNNGANYSSITTAYANANKPVFAVDYTSDNGHTYYAATTNTAICAWDKQQGFEGYIYHDDPDGTYRYECGP